MKKKYLRLDLLIPYDVHQLLDHIYESNFQLHLLPYMIFSLNLILLHYYVVIIHYIVFQVVQSQFLRHYTNIFFNGLYLIIY